MRSNLSWPSLAIGVALLAAACAPEKRNYDHDFYAFGTIVSVAFFSISEEDDKKGNE